MYPYSSTPFISSLSTKHLKDYKLDDIIGDIKSTIMTRKHVQNLCSFLFCLTYRAKDFFKTEKKAKWISTMQEELGQFKKSDVWA